MKKDGASRTLVPPSFFAKAMLPFALPILLTFALLILVGESWPRNLVPGSGLKLAGFLATMVTSLLVWRFTARGVADPRAHKMAALLCGMTGLMGWPVWSVGIMPSINGFSLGPEQTARMALKRTEVTTVSRSNKLNHWAWLQPDRLDSPVQAGRYFIPEGVYQEWSSLQPATVTVTFASGMLGAQVVTGYGTENPQLP